MAKNNSSTLFDRIAPVYGLFYNYQKKRFREVIDRASEEMDLNSYRTILDVGCGTGALCSVLNEIGLTVTGIDPAARMLSIARGKPENARIIFIQASVLDKLPFEDKSFDVSIASYVAHGMQKNEREKMYSEMSRVTKNKVIIYDYNNKRAVLTSLIERLEGGDYFRFIESAETEMKNCVSGSESCFSEVRVLDVDVRGSWYICTPT
mgnify:CR=1 FL=1